MRFELDRIRPRVFGGSTLMLVALEDGHVSRSRIDAFDMSGEPKLIYERALISSGQQVKWRTRTNLGLAPGDIVGAEALPHDPGPISLEWRGTHLL